MARPSVSRSSVPCMHPRSLLLAATLVLDLVGLVRGFPTTPNDSPVVSQHLSQSQRLLQAVSSSLQTARQTLTLYPCAPEEVDHVDITRGQSRTAQACLPRERAANSSCLPWGKDPLKMRTLCLRSIHQDLALYRQEFRALNAKLLTDPQRQISVDQSLLSAIEGLMQALTSNGESEPQEEPAEEEPDFYRAKVQLCVLLQALHVRTVTIDRMMSYLAS